MCQIDGEDLVNFCGLLKKHELYYPEQKIAIRWAANLNFLLWSVIYCVILNHIELSDKKNNLWPTSSNTVQAPL